MIDSQLMERFVVGRDSQAFRNLVARHGPAVLRVCRRFVNDPHAAEDAMQATFLILVRRAPSIQDPEQIDRWLTGVARKVAARARKQEINRAKREQLWAETHRESGPDAEKPIQVELRRAVHEELGQLPNVYRQPLTLCYLDGLTHEEAADQIGCPVGTVKARLVRGRNRLRDRLDRRGVALSLGLFLFLLQRSSASAEETLVESTAKAMALAASNDFEALKAQFPRAWALSQSSRIRVTLAARKPALGLLLGLVALGFGGGTLVCLAASDHVAAKKASARLLKALVVDCKVP